MTITATDNHDDTFPSTQEESMIVSSVKQLKRNPVSATSVADFVSVPKNHSENLEQCKNAAPNSPFAQDYSNMASSMAGAKMVFATDDWFAAAENILHDSDPIFDPEAFCETGKVMDGWETRRRRQAGHDWCLIQLTNRTEIHAVELDTAHFTGNNVPKISIDVCDLNATELSKMVAKIPDAYERILHGGVQGTARLPEEVRVANDVVSNGGTWKELIPTTPLAPGFETTRMHYVRLDTPVTGNLVRINYYPDGGVARCKIWGNSKGVVKPATTPLYMPIQTCEECTVVAHSSTDQPPPSRLPYEYTELSSSDEGGVGGECSNKHYGEPWRLIQPTLGKDMGDGWETARHPHRPGILMKKRGSQLIDTPLSDWAIMKLGRDGCDGVARVILDTKHFRGNFPESVLVEGCYDPREEYDSDWFCLIPRSRMSPDAEHVFERSKGQLTNSEKPTTHIRVSIYPDGGLSRVRIYG
jgi:allantoicase